MDQSVLVWLGVALAALAAFSIAVVALRRVSDQPLLWWWAAWSIEKPYRSRDLVGALAKLLSGQ